MGDDEERKPNLTGLKPRAFVCNVDTHLGKTLCKTLSKKGDYEIWGTNSDDSLEPAKGVHKIVSRDEDRAVQKCLLDSDLIIYELKDGVEDATTAIKLLMGRPGPNGERQDLETEKTFILVSSVLSWAETKQNAELPEEEKEEGAEEEEPEEEPEQEPVTEDMYNKRVPHVKYTAWKEVEKLCKQARSKSLHTYVVFAGLLYGEGEDALHPLFKQAWHLAPEGLPIFGTGKNIVPMIHVQDLSTMLYKIASKDEPEEQKYYFGCDEGNVSWNAITKAVNDHLGQGKTYKVTERDYILYENIERFIINLKVEAAGISGLIDDEEEWVSKAGFVEGIEKVITEYKNTRHIQPLRVAIIGPPAAGKSYAAAKLAEHYKLNHITVKDVVSSFEAQSTQLETQLANIKQKKKEEKRKARLEEKRRLKAEAAAEKSAAKAEAAENGEEEEEEEAANEEAENEEEEEEEEEGEDGEAEEDEDDEETEKIKERLAELKLVLNMKIKVKKAQEEEDEKDKNAKGKKGKPAMKGKMKKDPNPPVTPLEEIKPLEAPRYTDKCLAIMYRWKLSQPACRNQGYVLDGYPKTVKQARLLFEEGELEAPEEGAEDEEEEDPEKEGEEAELKKTEDKFMPDRVICLASRDEFLTERLMQITDQAEHNNPADFQRRLDLYKANNKPSNGVAAYLESVLSNAEELREVSVRDIAVDQCPLLPPPPPASILDPIPEDPAFNEMLEFIGESRNYGPTPQEIEQAYLKEIDKEKERQRLVQKAEAERMEREANDHDELEKLRSEEALRLDAIHQQERQMLELRKEPLKKYLMENVIPILTQGLIEVCEVHPEDPIDYLAEWLFRHNPQNEGESA